MVYTQSYTVAELQIIREVEAHIAKSGTAYSAWYAGIATDPRARLFSDHNVSEDNGWWIYRDCGTDTSSRRIEDYFLAKGCKGGPGGGDSTTRYFYAYRITASTRE